MHGLDLIKWRMLDICTYAECISQDPHLLLGISRYLTITSFPQEHTEAADNDFVNS